MKGGVILVGATSAIARALAGELAGAGKPVVLAGRGIGELSRTMADLRLRHDAAESDISAVSAIELDVLDTNGHAPFLDAADAHFQGGASALVLCHGLQFAQEDAERDPALALAMIDVNYRASVSLLLLAARRFASRGNGVLCVVSSVAGDRGRPDNFAYGSTKGALSLFLDGLRLSLAPKGVRVLDVKPGFVDTALTFRLLPATSPLVASPRHVARDIAHALEKKTGTLYTPWIWRWIMLIIRLLPGALLGRVFRARG